jgi:hypothetical protein
LRTFLYVNGLLRSTKGDHLAVRCAWAMNSEADTKLCNDDCQFFDADPERDEVNLYCTGNRHRLRIVHDLEELKDEQGDALRRAVRTAKRAD